MIYAPVATANAVAASAVDSLGGTIESVGGDAFIPALAALLGDHLAAEDFLVLRSGPEGEPPRVLHAGGRARRLAVHLLGGLRSEPRLTRLLAAPSAPGTQVLQAEARAFRSPAFRRNCFALPGIRELVILVRPVGDDLITLCLFRRAADPRPPATAELAHLGTLLLPVLDLHFRLLGTATRQRSVSAQEMEDCVAATFPELTRREVAVCARSILGVTAEGIALDLGIKQTSVVTYRRRAYTRLNISSINQLSTMLIQSSAARQLAAA
ncbi:helix-turn-helix transcriptional regulator [Celeribacter indicus]|uniref:Regulatory protein LuxR n=2 Tax=Celeribacter indicus TaxID=1208324 RepID=A0A0B5E2X9_9RHOB|nr:LuxR C-terminal-related transcriptional regulator [Celeribacter indicus]AJE46807.1 regulatory protein LuxR [Celeribacter indicus]SDW81448.1 DNA-binding transcriptional regulator, CsgD family [Celeribacter indicus]